MCYVHSGETRHGAVYLRRTTPPEWERIDAPGENIRRVPMTRATSLNNEHPAMELGTEFGITFAPGSFSLPRTEELEFRDRLIENHGATSFFIPVLPAPGLMKARLESLGVLFL